MKPVGYLDPNVIRGGRNVLYPAPIEFGDIPCYTADQILDAKGPARADALFRVAQQAGVTLAEVVDITLDALITKLLGEGQP